MLQAFYSGLVKKGESVEFAVHDASSELRAAEATRAPYYWAGWQVIR